MRVAVFVDAGYLFAQGSCAVSGLKTPKQRNKIGLNESAFFGLLKQLAHVQSGGKELLRIYWYDAAPQSGPSSDQLRIARSDYVKLRLGQLNSNGQQKGVDSLIVTDLMDLARNRAISDALLLTGDEDIRVGVQNAQSNGVRVHLLGIASASEKDKQSETLQQEADTVAFLNSSQVGEFLSVENEIVAEKLKVVAPAKQLPARNHSEIAAEQVINWLREQEKLEQAAKVAGSGKEPPGYAVKELNDILTKILGSKPTNTDKKSGRVALAVRLKAIHNAP